MSQCIFSLSKLVFQKFASAYRRLTDTNEKHLILHTSKKWSVLLIWSKWKFTCYQQNQATHPQVEAFEGDWLLSQEQG